MKMRLEGLFFMSEWTHPQPEESLSRQTEPVSAEAAPAEGQGHSGAPPRFSLRLLALCLCCALLGGVGGAAFLSFAPQRGGTSVLYEGLRPEVVFESISTERREPLSIPEIYAGYVDACVGISVDIVTKNFFGQTVTGAAAGSGFVVTEDGYIVTNYHVLENANSITVSFVDGSSYPASYIGGDEQSDIAVLKIDVSGLHPVIIGDSDQMNVGERVATIGNPLGELTFSLSDGVVSALDRSITLSDASRMNMLQTNCTINSGNSGGPLFNPYGEVIGIVSAKYSSSAGVFSAEASVEGLGFAIPMNDVKELIADLIEQGYISGRPYLGVSVKTVEESVQRYGIPAGAEIIYAVPGLAAAKAGLREGDIITAVNGSPIRSNTDLIDANSQYQAGDSVEMRIFRNGGELTLSVTYDEKNNANEQRHNDYAAGRAAEEETQQGARREGGELPGEVLPDGYGDSYDHFFNW